MQYRTLGQTGLKISRLGVGLSELGNLSLAEESTAGAVLNRALDAGLNFLDTSACYNNSEALIGRTIAHRRQEYVLATKCCGHRTGADWTAQTITDSIDHSLKQLKTDYLDLVQLHSCGVEELEQGEVIEALQAARQAGKTRYIGYSGDNEAARWAVDSGLFDTLQTSFNLVDQRARAYLFPPAGEKGMGIIAKRPIANGVWGVNKSPSAYASQYFERAQAMRALGALPNGPENGIVLALGFTLAHNEVDTVIVGTRNPEHMRANIEWFNTQLPINQNIVDELRHRFEQVGQSWVQLR